MSFDTAIKNTLNYDQFNKLINIEDVFKPMQDVNCVPIYENGELKRSYLESRLFKLPDIKSDYTLLEIMSDWFDSDVRKLFFIDLKQKMIECNLTHLYAVHFTSLIGEDGFPHTKVVISGCCDNYQKILKQKLLVFDNLNNILNEEVKNEQN